MNFENWDFGFIPTIFICVLLPLSLYFSYWLFITGIIGLYRMKESTRWKYCIGEITNAEIKYKSYSGDNDTEFSFTLVKTYNYVINGVEYESNQTYASDYLYLKEYKDLNTFPKIDKKILKNKGFIKNEEEKEMQIGKKTTVYYDKNNPKKSCLINRINNQIYLPIFMGLLFGIGATFMLIMIIGSIIE